MSEQTQTYPGSFWSYTTGFIGSLLCTFAAYELVSQHLLAPLSVLIAVIALAVLQLGIQLVFFLHLGRKAKGWNLIVLVFALIIVAIVVGGSLWIMMSLNTRMMPSTEQMDAYMNSQDAF